MAWKKPTVTQSLNMLLSKYQAFVDFLYKHIHLMYFYSYFSTCWMICIVFSFASWFKTLAFWTVFLRILWIYEMYLWNHMCFLQHNDWFLYKWRIDLYLYRKKQNSEESIILHIRIYSSALFVQVKTMHNWLIVLLLMNVTVCTYQNYGLL